MEAHETLDLIKLKYLELLGDLRLIFINGIEQQRGKALLYDDKQRINGVFNEYQILILCNPVPSVWKYVRKAACITAINFANSIINVINGMKMNQDDIQAINDYYRNLIKRATIGIHRNIELQFITDINPVNEFNAIFCCDFLELIHKIILSKL